MAAGVTPARIQHKQGMRTLLFVNSKLHPLCLFSLSKYPLAALVVILTAKRLLDK